MYVYISGLTLTSGKLCTDPPRASHALWMRRRGRRTRASSAAARRSLPPPHDAGRLGGARQCCAAGLKTRYNGMIYSQPQIV